MAQGDQNELNTLSTFNFENLFLVDSSSNIMVIRLKGRTDFENEIKMAYWNYENLILLLAY